MAGQRVCDLYAYGLVQHIPHKSYTAQIYYATTFAGFYFPFADPARIFRGHMLKPFYINANTRTFRSMLIYMLQIFHTRTQIKVSDTGNGRFRIARLMLFHSAAIAAEPALNPITTISNYLGFRFRDHRTGKFWTSSSSGVLKLRVYGVYVGVYGLENCYPCTAGPKVLKLKTRHTRSHDAKSRTKRSHAGLGPAILEDRCLAASEGSFLPGLGCRMQDQDVDGESELKSYEPHCAQDPHCP